MKVRVLLVEDEPTQQMIISEFITLSVPEAEVVTSDTLGDALEKIHAGGLDVILLDLGLPDGEGLEVVITASEAALDIPIIVLTAQGEEGLGALCIQAGAQDFLLKQDADPNALGTAIRFAAMRKTEAPVLGLSRTLAQLKTLTGESNFQASPYLKIYKRLLNEPRFLLTPDHQELARKLAQSDLTPVDVIALHARALEEVCQEGSEHEQARFLANSSTVVLATLAYLAGHYRAELQNQKSGNPPG